MEEQNKDSTSDLVHLVCNDPCYSAKFVSMVDEKNIRLSDLRLVYDYTSNKCDYR